MINFSVQNLLEKSHKMCIQKNYVFQLVTGEGNYKI